MWGRAPFEIQTLAVLTLKAVSQDLVWFHVTSFEVFILLCPLILQVNSAEQYSPPEHGRSPRGLIFAPHKCSCSSEIHPLFFSPSKAPRQILFYSWVTIYMLLNPLSCKPIYLIFSKHCLIVLFSWSFQERPASNIIFLHHCPKENVSECIDILLCWFSLSKYEHHCWVSPCLIHQPYLPTHSCCWAIIKPYVNYRNLLFVIF